MTPNESKLSVADLAKLVSYDPTSGTLNKNTWKTDNGYLILSIRNHKFRAHRVAWALMTGTWPEHDIDHINRDRADNRWCNLRQATRAQNLRNARLKTRSKTGFKGVHQPKGRSYYIAYIRVNYKKIHLGCFTTPQAAHERYMEEARKLSGEFARAA